MLKIGEFSKLSRVSVRMLRHYDEIGLLRPMRIDRATGYRYYTAEQLPVAGRIAALKEMGFALGEIGGLLAIYDDRAALDRRLAAQEEALRTQAGQIARRLRLLETARDRMRKDEHAMEYNVTLKTLPERKVASVRMTIPCYEQEGLLWDTLMRETAPLRIVPDEPCYCSVTLHDCEYKEHDVDVEAQKTVRGDYPDTAHVHFRTVPAVTFASTTFQGPYDRIDGAMVAVAQWVQDNGFVFDGAAFCIYHVSPHETDDPGEFVTEVCYPVKKAEAGTI